MRAACLLVLLLMGCGAPRRPPVVPATQVELEELQAAWFVRGERTNGDRLAFLLDRYGFLDRAALVDAELESADARERASERLSCLHFFDPPVGGGTPIQFRPERSLEEAQAWVREWPADPCGLLTLAVRLEQEGRRVEADPVYARAYQAYRHTPGGESPPRMPQHHDTDPERAVAVWLAAHPLDIPALRRRFSTWEAPVDIRPAFSDGQVLVHLRQVAAGGPGWFIHTERIGPAGPVVVDERWVPTLAFRTDAPSMAVERVALSGIEPEGRRWREERRSVEEAVLPGVEPVWPKEKTPPTRIRWRLAFQPPDRLTGTVEAVGPVPRAGALEAALAALAPRAEVAAVERTPGGYRAWISVPSRLAVLSDAVVRALSGTDTGEVAVDLRWPGGFHPAPAWSSVIGVESPGRLARRLGHEPDPAPAGLEFQAVEGGDGADLR
ncbi:MAG: hypothetical protein R3F60_29330 [bacterium]